MSSGPVNQRFRGSFLARSAVLLVALTAVSQLLALVRDAVIAAVYGASAEADAYLVAQGVMNLALGLVAAAVARSTVPTVSRAVAEGAPERGHISVRVALSVTIVVLVVASAVMAVSAPALVRVLASGFDPPTSALAVDLTRIVLLATVFIAGTNILAAAAQAHGRFFWAGLEGVPFNLVMIATAAFLGSRYGIAALAWGFVLGSAARLAVQLPAVRAVGLSLKPSFAVRDPGFRELVALVPPLLVGSALVNINTLVARAVGSSQGTGVISALNYGWRLVQIAEVLLVAAVVSALYPAFGALGRPEHRGELRRLVGRSVGATLVLLAPVFVMLTVAAEPMVQVVFGRGEFDEQAITLTSIAVRAFAVSVVATGVRELVARAFYSAGDSRTPVLIATFGMLVNVAGALTLGRAYGVLGLAGSTSVSVVVVAVLTLVTLRVRHDGVDTGQVVATLARVLAGGVLAALPTLLVVRWIPAAGLLGSLATLLAAGLVCLAAYLVALRLLHEPLLSDLVTLLRRALSRRRPKQAMAAGKDDGQD